MEHEEVPKEEAAVESSGAVKKRYGDQHLAIGLLPRVEEMDPGQRWVPKEVGCCLQRGRPAVLFLHGIRDMIIRGKARTMLQEEPLKDGCSGRNIGHKWNATSE
jgi:hypothetical protein